MKKSILVLAAGTLLAAALPEAKAAVSFNIHVGAPVYVQPVAANCSPPAVVVTRPTVPPPVIVYQTPVSIRPVPRVRVLFPLPPAVDFHFGLRHHHRPLRPICW
jgi:hypothetical protein